MADTVHIDNSTVVWSNDPDALGMRPLVVLMHGRGSHEHDLAGLFPLLPAAFHYASPRAPLDFAGGGFSWFAAGPPGSPPVESVEASVTAVLEWLDHLAPSGPVAVGGFSQGGAMATHLMRHAPERFFAFVNLSGFIVPGDAPADERLRTLQPPVFWGRDVADPVIAQEAMRRTAEWLPAHSTLTERVYPGIGHSISREEVAHVSAFLSESLRGAH